MKGYAGADAGVPWTSSAIAAALLVLVATAIGVILWRRRMRESMGMDGANPDAPRSAARGVTNPLLDLLDQAAELAADPVTALALIRMRKAVVRTIEAGDYDDDIADALGEIVGRRLAVALVSYGRDAGTIDDERRRRMDDEMGIAIDTMRIELEALVERQISRDGQPPEDLA